MNGSNYTTYVEIGQATASKRRFYFHLVALGDGFTPATAEAAGQPQISVDGGAWTSAASTIGALSSIGNGDYYADLHVAQVATAKDSIRARYKSANTREARAENVIVVGGVLQALSLINNDVLNKHVAGEVEVYDGAGYQTGGGTVLFTRRHTAGAAGNSTLTTNS